MTKDQLLDFVIRTVTFSNSLPQLLPNEEILRIVDETRPEFYNNANDALEPKWFVLESRLFQSPEWRKHRAIILPECVWSVSRAQESGGLFRQSGLLKQQGLDRIIAAEVFMGANQNLGDNLTSMAARMQFIDLTRSFFLGTITTTYNNSTNKLVFEGRDPRADVLLKCWAKIEDFALFENYHFQQIVIGKTFINTGTMLSAIDYQIPGEGAVKYNAETYKSMGTERVTKAWEDLQKAQPIESFMFAN
jgi:hypothetical protein